MTQAVTYIRGEEIHNSIGWSFQCQATDQENGKHQVWESWCHIHSLHKKYVDKPLK